MNSATLYAFVAVAAAADVQESLFACICCVHVFESQLIKRALTKKIIQI